MIFSFLKKHSSLCALAAAAAAMFAAPYLVAAEPDSPVFRSGVLSAILLLSCALPAARALKMHSRRSILYGCFFAWIFALFLGIGHELTYYGEFLSGMGSLVRRLAVPFMAAPLLGLLGSYLFECRVSLQNTRSLALPYGAFFLLFLLCYGAVMLAFYPGILNYDFEFEISQFLTGEYLAMHPVFHSMLTGVLYSLGNALGGSMTAGAAVYSAVQLASLAAMYAGVCCFVQKRVPAPVTVFLAACFAFLPFHGILAVSTVKDAYFSGLCALLCVQLWSIAESPSAFFSSARRAILLVLTCLFMALVRHNAVFAYVPACVVLFMEGRGQRRRAALLCAALLAVCLGVPRVLETAVDAEETPDSELMSIPCQQLMRTAEYADLSAEEYEALNDWFSGQTFRYRPHSADPAKGGNFNYARYQQDPGAFWSTYFSYAARYPVIYLEAFLQNCAGLWNPDDTSHAHALDGEDWDYVYLKTGNIAPEIIGEIEAHSYLPRLRSLLVSSAHNSSHEQIPLLSLLFRPSIYTYLLLLTTLRLFKQRQKRLALCLLPLWGIFTSLVFSACILVRYAYPLMTCVPVMLVLAFFAGSACEITPRAAAPARISRSKTGNETAENEHPE